MSSQADDHKKKINLTDASGADVKHDDDAATAILTKKPNQLYDPDLTDYHRILPVTNNQPHPHISPTTSSPRSAQTLPTSPTSPPPPDSLSQPVPVYSVTDNDSLFTRIEQATTLNLPILHAPAPGLQADYSWRLDKGEACGNEYEACCLENEIANTVSQFSTKSGDGPGPIPMGLGHRADMEPQPEALEDETNPMNSVSESSTAEDYLQSEKALSDFSHEETLTSTISTNELMLPDELEVEMKDDSTDTKALSNGRQLHLLDGVGGPPGDIPNGHRQPVDDVVDEDDMLAAGEPRSNIVDELKNFEHTFENTSSQTATTALVPVASGGLNEHRFDGTMEMVSGGPGLRDDESSGNYCHTEELTAVPPNQLCVGFGRKIPRWAPRSVIKCIVRTKTFLSKKDATHAATSFVEAADKWNKKLGGIGPRFELVNDCSAANCQLMYKAEADDPRGDPFASAFFPGSKERTVHVYAKAFKDNFRGSMINIFYHELGHVLGLRHEFAPEREQNYKSVLVGPRNNDSVMNYFPHPSQLQIHDLDVEYVRKFYNFEENQYKGLPIEDKVPQSLNSLGQVPLSAKTFVKMDLPAGPNSGIATLVVGVVAVAASVALLMAKAGAVKR